MTARTHTRRWLVRLAVALIGTLAALVIAAAVNVIGIRLVGSVSGWDQWLQQHRFHLALWRGAVYAGTACGWWWMRTRLLHREPSAGTSARLLRVEIASIVAITMLEATLIVQSP